MDQSKSLKNSLRSASFDVLTQFLFRIVTFVLNAYVIRNVNSTLLGIINVRLALLETTLAFITIEPILKSCQLQTPSRRGWQSIINQVWLSIPLKILTASALVLFWIGYLERAIDNVDVRYQYRIACYLIGCGGCFEQLLQLFTLIARNYSFVRLKSICDSIGFLSRCSIFVLLVVFDARNAICWFAIAYFVSILVMLVWYAVFFTWYIRNMNEYRKEKKSNSDSSEMFENMTDFHFDCVRDFLPDYRNGFRSIDPKLCSLTFTFWKQSVLKQVLTEGEKFVMTLSPIFSFNEQSVYDIVNNLGSLAARFLFRPIETNSYYYFTKQIDRNRSVHDPVHHPHLTESIAVFQHIFRLVSSIGLVIIVFGQSYTPTVLWLYGGHKLNIPIACTLLKYHSFSMFLIAVNGISECFCAAIMNTPELNRSNRRMVQFSIVFLLAAYTFVWLGGGAKSLILANSLNMLLRIALAFWFLRGKFANTKFDLFGNGSGGGCFDFRFFSIAVICGGFLKLSESFFYTDFFPIHLSIGAMAFGAILFILFQRNRFLFQLFF